MIILELLRQFNLNPFGAKDAAFVITVASGAQTSTGIVVLLVLALQASFGRAAAGIEVVYEELAHLLQVPAKKCGVVYSHFTFVVKSLCFSHSRTGRS